ncbi:MAG: ABC transporter ATP-binding protein [Clostridia bacterium]|nr:ABC transporter ATP-binding protein [Clostridia bacterium]
MRDYLTLNGVCLNYHSLAGETQAIREINLGIKEHEFVAIIGPSGCGKTTMLSLIAGILKPSSGEIILDEQNVQDAGRDIGYMFQRDHLFGWRTIQKNVELGLEINGKVTDESRKKVLSLLDKYGLSEFSSNYPHELSGGMRQRAALLRTLIMSPKLLLLDEPFGALDYQTRQHVIDDVDRIIRNEKITSILVTHDISEAITMADKIVVLTSRPASIKAVIEVNLDKSIPPSKRKKLEDFGKLQEKIWRELDEK